MAKVDWSSEAIPTNTTGYDDGYDIDYNDDSTILITIEYHNQEYRPCEVGEVGASRCRATLEDPWAPMFDLSIKHK